MNLLPFDDTLGDARTYDPSGQYFRDVSFIVQGYYQSPALCFDCNAEGIKSRLNSRGWLIEQVTNETDAWFPQPTGAFKYRLYAVIATNFSDAQIRDQVIRDLSGFFIVTNVSFVTPPYSGPSNASTAVTKTGSSVASSPKKSGGSGDVNYLPSTPPIDTQTKSSWDDFAKSLGTGLGITAPVAILGGAVLLAVLLRR